MSYTTNIADVKNAGALAQGALSEALAHDAELLIIAARENDAAQIRRLVEDGACVDAQDKAGMTALAHAVKARNAAAATALVEAGADSEIESRNGWTPMALAVKGGSPTIIEIAMKGLDRNVKAANC